MLSRRIFETDFRTALDEELRRQNVSIKELAGRSGIPAATLYKITSSERDLRFSTIKKIVRTLEPRRQEFIAVVAAKFLLDEVEGQRFSIKGKDYSIRGYAANSLDECIIESVRAEKEGAAGIICAPILASIVERIVDVPVAIIKPRSRAVIDAIESIAKRV
jgi:predicted transcriptional regulator